jgi:putative membrane protein
MKLGVVAAVLAGTALAAYLIFHAGFGAIVTAVASVGWRGFAILCICTLVLFVVMGSAWFVLIPGMQLSRAATFIWGRLIRDSAAEVLPFSQFGGILIGARAVVLRGVTTPIAFASTVVDVTTDMIAQIVFIVVGISFLVMRFGSASRTGRITAIATTEVLLAIAASIVFILLQRRGLQLAERLAGRWLPRAIKQVEPFARAIEAIYDAPVRLALSAAIHLVGWLASAVVTLIAVRLMGGNINLVSIIAIDSIVCALRSAAIFVPAALGVQEAGYAMLMPLFGLPAEIGLAVSLLKRAREIAIGIPALLLWQAMEGRRALGQDAQLLKP